MKAVLCFASILLLYGPAEASESSPSRAFMEASKAFSSAEKDLNWVSRYSGEEALNREINRLKLALSCARLDWEKFSSLHKKSGLKKKDLNYSPSAASKPAPGRIRGVLSLLEKSRREFFSSNTHHKWDTILFLETRALMKRLLGDRFLLDSDAGFVKELTKAQNEGDLGRALIALYHLRKFREVLLLTPRLSEFRNMDAEKAARVLSAVRGSLEFLGKKKASRQIQAALRRLGGKAEEVGRPVLRRESFFAAGTKADRAEASNILAVISRNWNLQGRSGALLDFAAGSFALSAGDNEFALPLLESAQKAGVKGYLRCLIEGTCGICLEGLGRYSEAAECFAKARELALEAENGDYANRQLINQVSALLALNRFAEAQKMLRRSLREVESPKQELWIRLLLGNVRYARAERHSRNLKDAGTIYKRALERLSTCEDFERKGYLKALLLINLGNVNRKRALGGGDKKLLRKAAALAKQALEAARSAGAGRLSVIAGANLAELHIDLGDYDRAGKLAAWALEAAQTINYFEAAWRAHLYLGRIAEKEKDFASAKRHYEEAVEIVESYRRVLPTEEERTSFLRDKTEVYHSLVRVLLEHGKEREAFSVAERGKARNALESLGLKELMQSFGNDQEAVCELAKLLRKVEADSLEKQSPFAEEVSLAKLQEELETLKGQAASAASGKPALTFLFGKPPGAGSVQSCLLDGETLLEYFPAGERLAVWLISKNGVKAYVLGGSWKELQEKAGDFVEKKAEDKELASELGRMLLPDFEDIPAKLFIVPTGILHRLPFGALRIEGKYLVEFSAIRYAPSASVDALLCRKGEAPGGSGKGPVVAFANPDTDYDSDGTPDKQDLSFALKEAKTLSKLYTGARTYKGKQATEALCRQIAPKAGILHLACHGLFKAQDPWHSTLFLTKSRGVDGTLEAWEVMGMDLREAGLVTLSGCETGVSSVRPGDNTVGLPMGFMLAGARTLVASFWPVEDRATSGLMAHFYRGLAEKLPLGEALRKAKLSVLRNPEVNSPRNWAGFALFGRSDT